MARMRWGDAADDEDVLPAATSIGPNEKGVITNIEYFRNQKGDAIKKTTKIQVLKTQTKVYEVTKERKQWAPFGFAAKDNAGVTIQSVDEVQFERTNKPKKADKDKKSGVPGADKPVAQRSLADMLAEKRRNREMLRAKGLLAEAEAPPGENDVPGLGGGAPKKDGVYVPPAARKMPGGVMPMQERRDADNSLRVSNLSENVTEQDLKELFGAFGDILRVYVAYDRETQEHRGFAFVNFRSRHEAEKAIKNLDGYGYDNMILRVEMAAPREPR